MPGLLLVVTWCIHRTSLNSGGQVPPRGEVKICFLFLICMFVTYFFALAYRPHGLIFKNFVEAVELMATEISARAITFSARGHVGGWGLDFWVKNSPSEMHWKIFRPANLGSVRPRAKRNEFSN